MQTSTMGRPARLICEALEVIAPLDNLLIMLFVAVGTQSGFSLVAGLNQERSRGKHGGKPGPARAEWG